MSDDLASVVHGAFDNEKAEEVLTYLHEQEVDSLEPIKLMNQVELQALVDGLTKVGRRPILREALEPFIGIFPPLPPSPNLTFIYSRYTKEILSNPSKTRIYLPERGFGTAGNK